MIRRHSLVWLRTPPATSDSPDAAKAWQQAGHPFIVCRTRPDEHLSLGFCLPRPPGESGSPTRIAAHANEASIERLCRPPDLRDAASRPAIPATVLQALLNPPAGCTVRLIGSRMWETLTGTRYTSETSDLDLVIDLTSPAAADAACGFLQAINSPVRIDAEISFPSIGEVHWKEWLSGTDPVLVKSLHTVSMCSRADFRSPKIGNR